jgi:hypothetical protein
VPPAETTRNNARMSQLPDIALPATDPRLVARYMQFALVAAAVTAGAGIVILAGMWLELSAQQFAAPEDAAMSAWVAGGFALAGLALLALVARGKGFQRAGHLGAAVIVTSG